MSEVQQLKAKDFKSNQEVRWCPGCGDYSIISSVQAVLAELGRDKDNVVMVSGIGCSSRFPVLHGHLRIPRHPRPGQRHRHRGEGRQSRTWTPG